MLTLLLGGSLSSAVDSLLPDFDLPDAPELGGGDLGPLSVVLSWLSFGRIPALMLLVIGLAGFSASGYSLQFAVLGAFGATLPAALAVLPAVAGAAYAMRWGGRLLDRLFGDETEAASKDDLVGSFATIFRGTARPGLPAEAKTTDLRGRTHYVLVEPAPGEPELETGSRVFLVSRSSHVYRAVTRLPSPKD